MDCSLTIMATRGRAVRAGVVVEVLGERRTFMSRIFLAALLALAVGVQEQASAQNKSLGKLLIRSAKAKVEGQEFTDQALEDSVRDMKRKAKKFTLVEDESEAEFLLVVVKRETGLGQPSFMRHKTPRNVNDIHATLSVKAEGAWKPGVQLTSEGCCKYWSDAAARVMNEAQQWIQKQARE